jgi:mannonate dehydratase
MFQVRTCWHNPGDISPVGIMANLTLDVTSNSFGLQEFGGNVSPQLAEVFQGAAQYKDGYAWVSDLPGWGIEIDEKAAAKYPFNSSQPLNGGWGAVRLPDGSIIHQ